MIKKTLLLLLLFFSLSFAFAEESLTETPNESEQSTSSEASTSSEQAVTSEPSTDSEQVTPSEQTETLEQSTDSLPTQTSELTPDSELSTEQAPQQKKDKVPLSIAGSDRAEVESFRQHYLTPRGEKQLTDALENAITYRLYVRKSLLEQGLPPELEYLPVVESNYKTHAKSKSGAIGVWQFMENSVKPFLVLNDYVDERYDPWKSTNAALKKLTDNYNYFKDWPIAIAAYNCGTGAMIRALAKSPEKDFWYMVDHNYLPSQTASYVPKLLAIADLAINHEYYELNIPLHEKEYDVLYNEKNALFDYVTVKKAYSINQLAQEMRIAPETLKELNPSFVRGYTHPTLESTIRLPLGTEQTARNALKKLKPMDFPVKYKVVAGDSLWAISRRYGTTVKAICELNGINESDILKIGKILYIPSK